MRFESGKYYRTRGGKKAFVAAVRNPFYAAGWPVVGFIEDGERVEEWQISGYWSQPEDPNDRDLIAEWKEPVTVTQCLALWSDGTTSLHDQFPAMPLSQLIAFKQVTITEGEGMP